MRGLVLVGGGTGFVGRYLVKHLQSKGYETITVSRQSSKKKLTWTDIKENGLPANTKAVCNVAGQNVLDFTKRWTESFKDQVYKSRVETTKLLADAINASSKPPEAFVTISGVGIYPPSIYQKYDESSKVEPYDFLSGMCHEWEKAAALKDNSHCRVVTIRSGVVLGIDGGIIKNLWFPFLIGFGGPMGSGNQWFPWIHMDDLTRLFSFSIENSKVTGILNGVSPQTTTNSQFAESLGQAMRRPYFIHTPSFVFNLVYGKERARMILEGQNVYPERTIKMGFVYENHDILLSCVSFTKESSD